MEGSLATKEVLPEARVAAARALELDPLLADAHVSQGLVLAAEWNWAEAEKEHQLAIKLGPNSWGAHASYAWYLFSMGRFDEAKSQIRNAGELDPMNPFNRAESAFVALFSREYDLAVKDFGDVDHDIGLGWAYGQEKMYSKAIFAFQNAARKRGRIPVVVANLAWAYGIAGRKLEAQKLIDELQDISRDRYVSPSAFVNAYVGLGDKNNALTWIERGYEERDPGLTWLKVFPIWDPLRSEPRFQAVLRRMNFPQ
jgi:tetratricopeptide (TPR) repeat protein